MKTIILTSCLLISSLITFSQENPLKDLEIPKADGQDHFMFILAHENWLDAPDSIDVKPLSRGINFYFMFDWLIGKSNFSIGLGTGFGISNVLQDARFMEDTLGSTVLSPFPDSNFHFDKNKLTTAFLDFPFELRYRTKPNPKGNSFKLALGFKFGLLLGSHIKYRGEDDFLGTQKDVKIKIHDIDNLAKSRYGPTFRIGHGNWSLYGYYSLSTLFEKDKGPEITPVTIGISLNVI